MFTSPGPIYEPEGRQDDPWRAARGLGVSTLRTASDDYRSVAHHAGWAEADAAHAQPMPLLHANGQASDLRIHEISPAGVLVESSETSAPADFDLWLPLPEQEPIALHGSRVRRTANQLTAFRLDMLPSKQSERLRHFIFQQHRLQHPQLQQLGPETIQVTRQYLA